MRRKYTLVCARCQSSYFPHRRQQEYCSIGCARAATASPPGERLRDRVDRTGGPDACWPYTSYCDPNGYGTLSNGKGIAYAHRLAYEAEYGPIPDGLFVLHHCDNPPCCNPKHHFLGTQADNVADMWKKGRGSYGTRTEGPLLRGESCTQARLTEDSVREIRRRHAAGDIGYIRLARAYGVSMSTIVAVVKRRNWKHVA